MSTTTGRWPQAITLKDRSDVLVRPLEPDDAAELGAAIERLSPESRYRRFLSPVPTLPASHLRSLTDVDHHTREALVAFDPSSRRGLGVARWGCWSTTRAQRRSRWGWRTTSSASAWRALYSGCSSTEQRRRASARLERRLRERIELRSTCSSGSVSGERGAGEASWSSLSPWT